MTPPTWLDADGRRRPTQACWTCGRDGVFTRVLYLILLTTLFIPRIGHSQPRGLPERITGYAGYQFGMSLDQAMSVDARMRQTHCDYFNVAYCLERDEDFYGEPGRIVVLFGAADKTIEAIHITFDRFEPLIPSEHGRDVFEYEYDGSAWRPAL